MEISTYDRSALISRTRAEDFDAVISQINFIEGFGEFQLSGYKNPEISRLRDAAWFTIDRNEMDKHMRELWQLFGAEIPITYLHPQLVFLAAHRRVKGMENNRDLFSIVEHLWIEDDGREPDE